MNGKMKTESHHWRSHRPLQQYVLDDRSKRSGGDEPRKFNLFSVSNSGLLFRHVRPPQQLLSIRFPPVTLTFDLRP